MNEIIKFEHVDKVYKIAKKYNLKYLILDLLRKRKKEQKEVLHDISFSINKSEKVAILGKNGSGKSTILKLITGVTFPTRGEVIVKEKVNALLELNSGFEQEFTGRENIYLKGILLGLKKEDIKKLEDKIIEFADIGEYIDYPIMTYSTGMRSRLGFAIAVHIEPEILAIDEALSVGDEEFKYKCLKKITEITQKDNVTLILVTHSMDMARQFCDRGIVVKKGNMIYDGKINDAVECYQKTIKKK